MSLDISVLGWLGLLVASPAIFISSRVAVRCLLDAVISDTKIAITYTDADKKIHKTSIYLDSDDELLKIIDGIAEKNKKVRKETTSHA